MGAPEITKIVNIIPESKPMWPVIGAIVTAVCGVLAAWIVSRRKK